MQTNEKTVGQQPIASKRKWKIWCVAIVIVLVVLGAAAGVIFTQQQWKYRQETLETLLLKVSQKEFAEAEEIYSSTNEKTQQFVHDEVVQGLMREGPEWVAAQVTEEESNISFDEVRELKSLAAVVGAQQLVPLIDKALELENYVLSAPFRKILEDDGTMEATEQSYIAMERYTNGLVGADYLADALYECANSYIRAAQKVEETGLEGERMQELYDFYLQTAESYAILAQGIRDGDSALTEQGKKAVQECLDTKLSLLEDVIETNESINSILEEMREIIAGY